MRADFGTQKCKPQKETAPYVTAFGWPVWGPENGRSLRPILRTDATVPVHYDLTCREEEFSRCAFLQGLLGTRISTNGST